MDMTRQIRQVNRKQVGEREGGGKRVRAGEEWSVGEG